MFLGKHIATLEYTKNIKDTIKPVPKTNLIIMLED